jgi:hypothetical protein
MSSPDFNGKGSDKKTKNRHFGTMPATLKAH